MGCSCGRISERPRRWMMQDRRWRRCARSDELEHQTRLIRRGCKSAMPQIIVHDDKCARRAHNGIHDCGPAPQLFAEVRYMSSAVLLAIRVSTVVLRSWEQLGRTHLRTGILWIVHDHEPVRLVLPAATPWQAFICIDMPHRGFGTSLPKMPAAVCMNVVVWPKQTTKHSNQRR